MVTLAYELNEMEYVQINEADSVFSKEYSLVEWPYVEPLFLGSLNPRSHGIGIYDTKDVMFYMLYDMFYV